MAARSIFRYRFRPSQRTVVRAESGKTSTFGLHSSQRLHGENQTRIDDQYNLIVLIVAFSRFWSGAKPTCAKALQRNSEVDRRSTAPATVHSGG